MAALRWLRDPRLAAALVVATSTATAFAAFADAPRGGREAAGRESAVSPQSPVPGPRSPVPGSLVSPSRPAAAAAIAPPAPAATLRAGLASADASARIAAVEDAVRVTAVDALPELQRFALARDPAAAPTVIHAIAILGASAAGAPREEAATTLAGWLRDETKRDALDAPDAPGNVSNLVEALGNVGGSRAVDALIAALDQPALALHVQTLAVMKLGELGDGRARAAVERFAKRVAALPASEGIDEELRVEAIEAARTTLSRI
jgi:HEAT repeat protein